MNSAKLFSLVVRRFGLAERSGNGCVPLRWTEGPVRHVVTGRAGTARSGGRAMDETTASPTAPVSSDRPTAQSSGSVQWDALRGQHGSGDVRAGRGPLGVLLAVAGPLVRVDAELPGGGDVVLAVVAEDHRGGDGHSPGLTGERLQQDLGDTPVGLDQLLIAGDQGEAEGLEPVGAAPRLPEGL